MFERFLVRCMRSLSFSCKLVVREIRRGEIHPNLYCVLRTYGSGGPVGTLSLSAETILPIDPLSQSSCWQRPPPSWLSLLSPISVCFTTTTSVLSLPSLLWRFFCSFLLSFVHSFSSPRESFLPEVVQTSAFAMTREEKATGKKEKAMTYLWSSEH